MAINLSRHGAELKAAYQDVLNDATDTDWAIFGYHAKTNELKVIETGDDGLSGMADELNSSAIQYVFCRVKDPNTGLMKNVLINWTGEGAPNNRKGACANHVRDVADFLKGAHVTINARNDDDIEEDSIVDKIAKSSGCNYSFHKEKPMNITPQKAAVGSVYQKTRAEAEIKTSGREQFWEKTESAEATRKADNVKVALKETSRLDDERRQREQRETEVRDKTIADKGKRLAGEKIAQQREQTRRQDKEKADWKIHEQQEQQEAGRGRPRSFSKEHTDEAASMIAQRGSNPRAMWEQKQSQFKSAPPPVVPKTKRPPPPSVQTHETPPPTAQRVAHPQPEPPVIHTQPEREPSPSPPVVQNIKTPVPQNIMAPPPLVQRQPSSSDEENQEDDWGTEEPAPPQHWGTEEPAPPQHWGAGEPAAELITDYTSPQPTYDEMSAHQDPYESVDNYTQPLDTGMSAVALYDYQAEDESEITFDPDDVINQIEQIDEGWWRGVGPDGHYGLFPANYVQLL